MKVQLVARPYDNLHWKEYDEVLMQVINQEEGLTNLTIVTGMDFGYTCSTFILRLGIRSEIDAENKTFSIIENALV